MIMPIRSSSPLVTCLACIGFNTAYEAGVAVARAHHEFERHAWPGVGGVTLRAAASPDANATAVPVSGSGVTVRVRVSVPCLRALRPSDVWRE